VNFRFERNVAVGIFLNASISFARWQRCDTIHTEQQTDSQGKKHGMSWLLLKVCSNSRKFLGPYFTVIRLKPTIRLATIW